jgi:hypothetical protein
MPLAIFAGPAVVFAMFFFLATPAFAQGTAQERSACMGDAFRFCSADIPNVSAIEACLQKNERELTPACRAEFQPNRKTKIRREHFQ